MKQNQTDKEQFTLFLNEKESVLVSSRRKKKYTGDRDGWYYLGLVGQMGYTIALPMVTGALVGKYIDSRWSVDPSATLMLLLLGSVVSFLGFIKTIRELIRRN